MIKFIRDQKEKKKISADILQSLPEWFGIPESTEEYIETSAGLPFWAVYAEGEPAGFLAMKETGPVTATLFRSTGDCGNLCDGCPERVSAFRIWESFVAGMSEVCAGTWISVYTGEDSETRLL